MTHHNDRPGLEVFDQVDQKWVGPIVLEENQVVVIGNRELEQITAPALAVDGSSPATDSSSSSGFVACRHRVASAKAIAAAVSIVASGGATTTTATRMKTLTTARLSLVMEVRATESGARAAQTAVRRRYKAADKGSTEMQELLRGIKYKSLKGGQEVGLFTGGCGKENNGRFASQMCCLPLFFAAFAVALNAILQSE